jgi:hypothetical protein
VQLFGIDGKAVREVETGEMDVTHVGEESVSVGPFRAFTKVFVSAEQLRFNPVSRQLTVKFCDVPFVTG